MVINNLNSTLFQAIKYLSRLRIKGIPVPANILLISLNTREVYKYNSENFLTDIEKIYFGASSKNNERFNISIKPEEINYNTDIGIARLVEILREEKYTKININEDCILGWAEKFYREHPRASKGAFIGDNQGLFPQVGEIREPAFFKDYIYTYKGASNNKFKYLMDCLNDPLRRRELGAFYTPIPYCEKAVELVREAIKIVPQGNDYIILDRCAGTGNLESVLTDEELSHCILSTYEYFEYKVLVERIADKVKYIIPPKESFYDGFVKEANAMSRDYIENEYLQEIINNSKITIILLENPPYRDETTGMKDNKTKRSYETSFVKEKMREEVNGTALNDISNRFIWSGFKYYLRQETDSYILFSPVKYFKSLNLVNKEFKKGFLFNRKHFHASPSAISCIWWQNINKEQENFILKVFDIYLDLTQEGIQEQTNKGRLKYIKNMDIKKVYKVMSELYDKRVDGSDINTSIFCGRDGYTASPRVKKISKSLYNENIVGYLRAESFGLDPMSLVLTRTTLYNGHGFYLRSDNFIEKLPIFCAKLYPQENWYEIDVYFTTADKSNEYMQDKEFLKSCLIYTCLSRYNKCLSFLGSDGRYYKNELCFDGNTLSDDYLKQQKLNNDENNLINIWNEILKEAKTTKEYKQNITYGVYEIEIQLNTFHEDDRGNTIPDYLVLDTKLKTLKTFLKDYYKNYIQNKLFEYELLK